MITFSARAESRVLSPHWNFCAGAGRAAEGLRAGWRGHLQTAAAQCGFRRLRFHGLLHDEMFVCRRDGPNLVFNWQYIDDLFDFLLETGVRPFVEFGFFPKDLAGKSDFRCFWWQAHVTPPEDYGDWAALIRNLVRHWVDRYGIREVRTWYFEVWNEPNLWFFFNAPRSCYFELYERTVEAVKSVDAALRVGGPATSNFVPDERFDGESEDPAKAKTHFLKDLDAVEWRGIWIEAFLEYCAGRRLPVDFVSCHPYPTDFAFDDRKVVSPRTRGVGSTLADLRWLRKTLEAGPFPNAEIHLTEWSSSPSVRDFAHDFPQAATFVAKVNIETAGIVDSLSYWTFTDVFEEHGAGDAAFHGGFGLINYQGIVKPAFHAYRFLHQLGGEEIAREPGFVATRNHSGGLRALAWNYPEECPSAPPMANSWEEAEKTLSIGSAKDLALRVTDVSPGTAFWVEVVDADAGFAGRAWRQMGSPSSPSREQTEILKDVGASSHRSLATAEPDGTLSLRLRLAPWAVALIRQID